MHLPRSILNLIDEFARLPGIGPKTASRLTFYLLTKPDEAVNRFGQAVFELKKNIRHCEDCFTLTDTPRCSICRNPSRDSSTVMVIAKPLDVIAMERTGYEGQYFEIGGLISPIDGVGPEQLWIKQLLDRLVGHATIKEVILATDPSLEGEATALYIASQIEKLKQAKRTRPKLKVTRLARGLPVGSELEYADELTLARSLEGRKEY